MKNRHMLDCGSETSASCQTRLEKPVDLPFALAVDFVLTETDILEFAFGLGVI